MNICDSIYIYIFIYLYTHSLGVQGPSPHDKEAWIRRLHVTQGAHRAWSDLPRSPIPGTPEQPANAIHTYIHT